MTVTRSAKAMKKAMKTTVTRSAMKGKATTKEKKAMRRSAMKEAMTTTVPRSAMKKAMKARLSVKQRGGPMSLEEEVVRLYDKQLKMRVWCRKFLEFLSTPA